jgi:glycosyltransferase involved in cell wall biosynthesis
MIRVLDPLQLDYEIVCVDDGSRDDTYEKLRAQLAGCKDKSHRSVAQFRQGNRAHRRRIFAAVEW